MLLQHACTDDAEYDAADGSGATFPFVTKDSPLLPNLGVANILGYFMDITVRALSPFSPVRGGGFLERKFTMWLPPY